MSQPTTRRRKKDPQQNITNPQKVATESPASDHKCSPSSSDEDDSPCAPENESGKNENIDELSYCLDNNLSLSPGTISPRRNSSSDLYPNLESLKDSYRKSDHGSSKGKKNNRKQNQLTYNWLYIILIILAIFGMICIILLLDRNNRKIESLSVSVEEVHKHLESIFKNQSPKSWLIVRSQLRNQIARNVRTASPTLRSPLRPAILLVVGPSNGTTLRCFSRKLGDEIAKALGRTLCVRAGPEADIDSGQVAKWQMDQVLRTSYGQGERCFHVQRLDSLSADELLMLHAWCDGDHSPYKDAVFIFSFTLKNTSSISVDSEAKIEGCLRERWNDLLGPDEAAALLSRVANNIVIVQEEMDSENFRTECLT